MNYQDSQEYNQPEWLEYPLSPADVAAINQGGCASGSFMPAVTYHKAIETMSEHGDDVLQYIEDNYGELPQPNKGEIGMYSWAGMAVFYLSMAVELFASSLESSEDWDNDDPITVTE